MLARGREPMRTCLGCRQVKPKAGLVRLIHREGRIVADRTGHEPGRGAYVCSGNECTMRARSRAPQALRVPGARWSVEELV